MNTVTYKLTDVNILDKTATLKARPSGKTYWLRLKEVSLSPLLVYRIKEAWKDSDSRQYDEVEFTSEVDSPRELENPLKLVRFEYSDGALKNFYVELVMEAGATITYMKDLFGRRKKKYENKFYSRSNYSRYTVVTLKDLNPNK